MFADSDDVDVEVLLPEAQLGLLQDAEAGPHGDADALQSIFRHVGQLDHPDVLLCEVLSVALF